MLRGLSDLFHVMYFRNLGKINPFVLKSYVPVLPLINPATFPIRFIKINITQKIASADIKAQTGEKISN